MADDTKKLRDKARAALGKGKYKDAARLYVRLAEIEPASPRWPHKAAEALHRAGAVQPAIDNFEMAIDRYAATGHLLKAIAVCKMILAIDPEHVSTGEMLATLYARRKVDATELKNAAIKIGGKPREAATGMHEAVPRATPEKLEQANKKVPPVGAAAVAEAMRAAQAEVEAERAAEALLERREERADAIAAAEAEIEVLRAAADKTELDMRADRARAMSAAQAEIDAIRQRSRATRTKRPTLTPGDSLDAVQLAQVVPHAREHRTGQDHDAVRDQSGSGSLFEIPLDDELLDELMVDELVDVAASASDDDIIELEDLALEVLDDDLLAVDGPAAAPPRPPTAASVAVSADDDLVVRHILETLPPTPLFSSLDGEALKALIERVEVALVDEGEAVIVEGTAGDALFVLVEGEVQLSREGRTLGTLGESSFFGEVALLTEVEHTATATAATECTLLRISREVISDLIEDYPEVLKLLLRFVRQRLVAVLIATSKLFAPFAADEREALSERFTLFEAEPHCSVLQRGRPADALYVLLTGRAQLAAYGDPPTALKMGDIFGASSLIGGSPSEATVRTSSKCWLLRLERSTFREIIMTHPQVLEAVSESVAAGYSAEAADLETISLEVF